MLIINKKTNSPSLSVKKFKQILVRKNLNVPAWKDCFLKVSLFMAFVLGGNSLVRAQFLPGFETSNYNGITGVYSNPANAVNVYKWDVHLAGMDIATGNKNARIKLSRLGDDNYLRNSLTATEASNDGMLSLAVPAVGFQYRINKKSALAFTTRGRILANASGIQPALVNAIADGVNAHTKFPYSFPAADVSRLNATALTDYALSWATDLFQQGPHYVKAGITLKYVAAVSNIGIQAGLTGQLDEDSHGAYMSPANGSIAVRSGGEAFIDDLTIGRFFKANGGGMGVDLGLQYEYRPQNWAGANGKPGKSHGQMPYLIKLGAALLSVGNLKYQAQEANSKSYDVHIPSTEKFYLSAFDGTGIGDLSAVLDKYPQYFTNTGGTRGSYKIKLPATLQLSADYNMGHGFFVNGEAAIGLNGNNDWSQVKTFNYYAITPRYEGRDIGFFLPVAYQQMIGLTVGAALHFGPLYLGSGSILSLLADGSRQADAFVGVRFGGLLSKK